MEQGSDQWLAARSRGIGGSDIGALMGLSKYRTPRDVWEDKTGRSEPRSSQAMEWGHRLEPVVLERFQESHPEGELERYPLLPGMHHHKHVPIAMASLDSMLRCGDGSGQPVDAKTSRMAWADGTVPPEYVMQVQWQMGVSGTEQGWIAALFHGSEYREYAIDFDKPLFEDALEYAQRFWRDHVLTDKPPKPTRNDDLSKVFTPEVGREVEVPESMWEAYAIAREQEDAAVRWRSMLEQDLKLIVGDATEVTCNGEPVASWRPRKGSLRVNRDRLKQEWPDVYQEVVELSEGTRTWRIK